MTAAPMLAPTWNSLSFHVEGGLEGVEHPLGDDQQGLAVGHLLAEHDELVSAEARERVRSPHHGFEPVSHLDQHLVSCGVAKAVVHELEAVEVQEHHHGTGSVAAPAPQDRLRMRSPRSALFGRPVRGSCSAWCSSVSSASLRSVMSRRFVT